LVVLIGWSISWVIKILCEQTKMPPSVQTNAQWQFYPWVHLLLNWKHEFGYSGYGEDKGKFELQLITIAFQSNFKSKFEDYYWTRIRLRMRRKNTHLQKKRRNRIKAKTRNVIHKCFCETLSWWMSCSTLLFLMGSWLHVVIFFFIFSSFSDMGFSVDFRVCLVQLLIELILKELILIELILTELILRELIYVWIQ